MGDGHARQIAQREIIVQTAVGQPLAETMGGLSPNNAAMPVAGVLAHAHVGDHHHLRVGRLDGPYTLLHDPLRVIVLAPHLILGSGQAKQQHSGDTQGGQIVHLSPKLVDGQMILARHGGNLLPHSLTMHEKQRIDEIISR